MIPIFLLACTLVSGCVAGSSLAEAPPEAPSPHAPTSAERQAAPSLMLVLTIDQLTQDLLERWRPQLSGGLARLLSEGAVFTKAWQDHAITETAPGHASILSGRFPYSTGIAANSAGVNTDDAPLIGSDGPGASPTRFVGTTLADWLTAADAESRVLSVSRKDRGAILPIGRGKHSVFWYALASGHFTTSTWYGESLPAWVQQFNGEESVVGRYAGKQWELLLPDSAYGEADDVPAESFGQGFTFPYLLPSEPFTATQLVIAFPFMDELTLDFALRGVSAMSLGTRGHTDLLAVSLSTTDAVGHRWGPDSREMHDQILRLDRSLGRFLDSLTAVVGVGKLAVVLTADHGGAPSPEVRSAHIDNRGAKRVMLDDFQGAINALAARATKSSISLTSFEFDGFAVSYDRDSVTASARDLDAAVQAFVDEAKKVDGVLRVDALSRLAKADTVKDDIARRWLHMFRPGGDVLAVVTLKPFNVFGTGNVATHGSPHDYDVHVPLIFWGTNFKPGRDSAMVRVVDIAPTLAAMLGVRVAGPVDGRPITRVLKPTP